MRSRTDRSSSFSTRFIWLARSRFLAALLDPYIRVANALLRVVLAPIFLLCDLAGGRRF